MEDVCLDTVGIRRTIATQRELVHKVQQELQYIVKEETLHIILVYMYYSYIENERNHDKAQLQECLHPYTTHTCI